MQIGSLTAFLSYLMQILMSIMMATFMLVMVPGERPFELYEFHMLSV